MNAILGFSQLIEIETKDDITKENVREIILASKHLLGLIDDLLELSQIETGKVKLCIESYNLKSILDFCISMVKSSAEKMSIRIDNKVDSLPDINIKVDNKRFKQVVLNLLSNAIKYNKKNGSVVIDYSLDDENMLCLSITDTGKGIDPQHYNQLFNHFDRAGQECSNIAGSGLGLAISKKLIDKMNGSIGFESTISEGSHFWVKVPLS
jgi:signal transduction histidine kinase